MEAGQCVARYSCLDVRDCCERCRPELASWCPDGEEPWWFSSCDYGPWESSYVYATDLCYHRFACIDSSCLQDHIDRGSTGGAVCECFTSIHETYEPICDDCIDELASEGTWETEIMTFRWEPCPEGEVDTDPSITFPEGVLGFMFSRTRPIVINPAETAVRVSPSWWGVFTSSGYATGAAVGAVAGVASAFPVTPLQLALTSSTGR